MKRIAASLLGIVFILGFVVSPALHKTLCVRPCLMVGICYEHHGHQGDLCPDEETPSGHDSNHCLVCQLAVNPIDVSSIVIAPIKALSAISEKISPPAGLQYASAFCNPHFARGPPNA